MPYQIKSREWQVVISIAQYFNDGCNLFKNMAHYGECIEVLYIKENHILPITVGGPAGSFSTQYTDLL